MSEEKLDIAKRLESEIKRCFKSKRAFAMFLGVSPQAIQEYTKGKISPGRHMLEKFKNAGLDVNYILYGERSVETASELREENERLKSEVSRLKRELMKRKLQIDLLKEMLKESHRSGDCNDVEHDEQK